MNPPALDPHILQKEALWAVILVFECEVTREHLSEIFEETIAVVKEEPTQDEMRGIHLHLLFQSYQENNINSTSVNKAIDVEIEDIETKRKYFRCKQIPFFAK